MEKLVGNFTPQHPVFPYTNNNNNKKPLCAVVGRLINKILYLNDHTIYGFRILKTITYNPLEFHTGILLENFPSNFLTCYA